MKYILLIVSITSLLITGCVHKEIVSDFRFDYRNPEQSEGVIRAFDDGQKTIVQFINLNDSDPVFIDQDGESIVYEACGQYAILPTIIDDLTVVTKQGRATFLMVTNGTNDEQH